jgi:hypothetical protein
MNEIGWRKKMWGWGLNVRLKNGKGIDHKGEERKRSHGNRFLTFSNSEWEQPSFFGFESFR